MIVKHEHCEKCDARESQREDKVQAQVTLGIMATVFTVIGVALILAFS